MNLKSDFQKTFKDMLTDKGYAVSDMFVTEMKDKFLKYENDATKSKYDSIVSDIAIQISNDAESKIIVKKLAQDFGLKSREMARDDINDKNKNKDNKKDEKIEKRANIFEMLDIDAGGTMESPHKSQKKEDHDKIINSKNATKNFKTIFEETKKKAARGGWEFYDAFAGDIDNNVIKGLTAAASVMLFGLYGTATLAKRSIMELGGGKKITEYGVKTSQKVYHNVRGYINQCMKEKAKTDIEIGKKATYELIKAFEESRDSARKEVDNLKLSTRKLAKINEIRGVDKDETIDKYQNELVEKNDNEIRSMISTLNYVKISKLYDELLVVGQKENPKLESEEIFNFIKRVKLDKDGMIVFPKSSRINEDFFDRHPEIEDLEIDKDIARVAETPDPSKMTDTQIEQLISAIYIDNGEIAFNFYEEEEVDSTVRKFAEQIAGKALYSASRMEHLQDEIDELNDEHYVTKTLLNEVLETNNYYTAEESMNSARKEVDNIDLESEDYFKIKAIRGIDRDGKKIKPSKKDIDKYHNELVDRNADEIGAMYDYLRWVRNSNLKNLELYDSLFEIGRRENPNLEMEQVYDFFEKVKLDKDGKIVFPFDSELYKGIFDRNQGIYKEVLRVAETPDPAQMTEAQIEQLSSAIHIDKDGKVVSFKFDKGEKVDPIVRKFADRAAGISIYSESSMKHLKGKIARLNKKHYVTKIVLNEVSETKKYYAAEESRNSARKEVDNLNLEPEELAQIKEIRGIDKIVVKNVKPSIKNIDKYQSELVEENDSEIRSMISRLNYVKISKLYDELLVVGQTEDPKLESEEIYDFIKRVKLDKDGMIVFPKSSRINDDFFNRHPEIEDLEIDEDIARVAETPDPAKMTDAQIEQLSSAIYIDNGEIAFNFDEREKVDSIVRKFADEIAGKALYSASRMEHLQDEIDKLNDEHYVTKTLLNEVSETNKYYTAIDLAKQFSTLEYINDGYDQREEKDVELSNEDIKARNNARKIASQKVSGIAKLLKSSSLSALITEGQDKQATLLEKAKGILAKDLQNLKNKDQNTLEDNRRQYQSGERS